MKRSALFFGIPVALVVTIMAMPSVVAQQDAAALQQKAAAGDPAAQVQLGMKYALASPHDVPSAMKWFQLAADQGYADGQFHLAAMCDVGMKAQNPTEAIKWYTLAANQGHRDAEYRLAVMYDQGRGTAKDETEAARWFT